MFRWRWCVIFLVLLVPARLSAKMDKHLDTGDKSDENSDENDDHIDDNDSNEDDEMDDEDDDDDDSGVRNKLERTSLTLKRTSTSYDFSKDPSSTARSMTPIMARTTKKKPLECYMCSYKSTIALQACLDPWKHRVHTTVCQNLQDRCFTWIVSKDSKYEAVTRGCKAGCVSSPETICCEFNRCNNQVMSLPSLVPQVMTQEVAKKTSTSLAKRPIPPTIMFFVTILLLLQTVVKVPIT